MNTRPFKRQYRVYINGVLKEIVYTEAEAWDVIGESSFGSLYEVRDAEGNVYDQFIPY